MTVLVTGGAGYIGSNTCIELLKKGERIVIVDNFSNSKEAVISKIESISEKKVNVYNLNILDKDGLSQVFKDHKIDSVIHFAGLKAVGESVENPIEYYINNVSRYAYTIRCNEGKWS